MSEEKPTLSVGIVERKLSDKSAVHSVVIRETRKLPFVELDCISDKHAYRLMLDIHNSIERNTNIVVSAF